MLGNHAWQLDENIRSTAVSCCTRKEKVSFSLLFFFYTRDLLASRLKTSLFWLCHWRLAESGNWTGSGGRRRCHYQRHSLFHDWDLEERLEPEPGYVRASSLAFENRWFCNVWPNGENLASIIVLMMFISSPFFLRFQQEAVIVSNQIITPFSVLGDKSVNRGVNAGCLHL